MSGQEIVSPDTGYQGPCMAPTVPIFHNHLQTCGQRQQSGALVDPRKTRLKNMEDEFVGNLKIGGVCRFLFQYGVQKALKRSPVTIPRLFDFVSLATTRDVRNAHSAMKT